MNSTRRRSWLLLRDGHAIPLTDISPEGIKKARDNAIQRDEYPLKHSSGLNAIVDCLGFKGDFGTYKREHWPRLQDLLAGHGLRRQVDLFKVPTNDLGFGSLSRRALADRLFLGPRPIPSRVFLGTDHDWHPWNALDSRHKHPSDRRPPLRDIEEIRLWVYGNRIRLLGFLNFIGDQLLQVDRPPLIVNQVYYPTDMDEGEVKKEANRDLEVMRAFRWFIELRNDGWVDIIRVTDNLCLLKGNGGLYDWVWRNVREEPPPHWEGLQTVPPLRPEDMPTALAVATSFNKWYYYHQDLWDEKLRHEAEQHYYANGGRPGPTHPGRDAILHAYLRTVGVFPERPFQSETQNPPEGFMLVTRSDGRRLLVSPLVTIQQMREMFNESGYYSRRSGDLWEPGNIDDPVHLPTAVTWYDAQAYCAWMEMRLGVRVRLPLFEEYREWFPETPSLVSHQMPNGVEKVEEWGGVVGCPERYRFAAALQWIESPGGLRTVSSCNVAEWVQNNNSLALHPNGSYSVAPTTWGAYKGVKTVFRVVIEVA